MRMSNTVVNSACRVCESSAGYESIFDQLHKCLGCGFITFDTLDHDALLDIYNDEYFSGTEYPDYLGQQDALRRSMRRHLRQMARYQPNKGSLLEVGCAYGLFLDEARAHFANTTGVDICEVPTTYAKEKLQLDVHCADFDQIDFGTQRYDVICLWDTIEHLGNPEVYLKKATSLLNEDGMIFLTTGDIGSLNARVRGANWRQIHPPSHLHYFSSRTITLLLNRLGMEVVGIETTAYYHTVFNIFASIRMRGGGTGKVAAMALNLCGEARARRFGFWIDLRDIMFVAARKKSDRAAIADRLDLKVRSETATR
jgi:ubiquinone/menaquinone biosynthesis C-methylase UbiE